MIYIDWLKTIEPKAEKAIRSLFEKAQKNQHHKSDLLLTIINGHYKDYCDSKMPWPCCINKPLQIS
ncbi:hypothetical protein PPO43_06535 [Saprospira sp. CCB-QB6]|uniref:hypothetical protein n=1 Tax=Saprospira sp. CCB-QB6 TaxID=3023936 RepID=UPI00234A7637|nr:hypothetical protein [Saprospira sp. CCB-QB6]WCL82747.1 hypothetical protein PPO43_06535 [Saprospira sp. CCB-QB6]